MKNNSLVLRKGERFSVLGIKKVIILQFFNKIHARFKSSKTGVISVEWVLALRVDLFADSVTITTITHVSIKLLL